MRAPTATNSAESWERPVRPLPQISRAQWKRILGSTVHAEREKVRYVLLNMPSRKGFYACETYLKERLTGLSQDSQYVVWRTFAQLTAEDGASPVPETDAQWTLGIG